MRSRSDNQPGRANADRQQRCCERELGEARAHGMSLHQRRGGAITNFAGSHEAELCDLVGVPDEYQIYCLIPLGYPIDRPGPVRRRPVKRVVFADCWEQPWAFAEVQPDEGWCRRWV
jgi:hypothetical protein